MPVPAPPSPCFQHEWTPAGGAGGPHLGYGVYAPVVQTDYNRRMTGRQPWVPQSLGRAPNSKRKVMPFGVMVMMLNVALVGLGIGYGLWSQELIIDGTVQTGEMDPALSLGEIDQMADFDAICPTNGDYSIDQDCDGDRYLNGDMEAEGKESPNARWSSIRL